ncbi:hypothetical protein M9H77_07054 [Catharanthus roseus]|uniref:Uncharacterized protein n=1 Tax=Catharanthus roseus TaxID=4058 RepID=A0ACC0BU22_CATRO|nr:hypothetical protein M9H77_07054 [Catharanthus roseus]
MLWLLILKVEDVKLSASRKQATDGHNDDPLVITMTVDQCLVKMILVDTRSSVNVLFLNTFVQMDIPWSRILSYEAPIVGFTGKTIKSGEKITLPVSIGDTRLNIWNKDLEKTRRYQSLNLKENLNYFIVECSFSNAPVVCKFSKDDMRTTWILNVDESTGEKNRGARFILEDPPITNNKVEYEALLRGLRMASSLKISHLCVQSDSQVIIGQVTCVFEAKEENMKKYLACVQQLITGFFKSFV